MKFAAAMVFALAVAAPLMAQAQPVLPAKSCLRQNMVYGWKVVDDRTLIVTDRVGKRFKLSLSAGCHDLKFNLRLAFKAFSGVGLSCLGHNDYVLVPPGGGEPAQRCLIADIQEYTTAMQQADAVAKSSGK